MRPRHVHLHVLVIKGAVNLVEEAKLAEGHHEVGAPGVSRVEIEDDKDMVAHEDHLNGGNGEGLAAATIGGR
jgi:hypothetical protein